jgi:hypothetical protein
MKIAFVNSQSKLPESEKGTLDLLAECCNALHEACVDIGQTARANQMNLNGRDIVFPSDATSLPSIGKTIIHQEGIDQSLEIQKKCVQLVGKILRLINPTP